MYLFVPEHLAAGVLQLRNAGAIPDELNYLYSTRQGKHKSIMTKSCFQYVLVYSPKGYIGGKEGGKGRGESCAELDFKRK